MQGEWKLFGLPFKGKGSRSGVLIAALGCRQHDFPGSSGIIGSPGPFAQQSKESPYMHT